MNTHSIRVPPEDMTFEEWIGFIEKPKTNRPEHFIDYTFPDRSKFEKYIQIVSEKTDVEIKHLLRGFLISGGTLGSDQRTFEYILTRDDWPELIEKHEFCRRLFDMRGKIQTWEGNTWVLDLLPNYPRQAIHAIDSYLYANIKFMPDGRIRGLIDAMSVIRAKYLKATTPQSLVSALSPREFECLLAGLYKAKGYDVQITQASRDGGYDVLAEAETGTNSERILIECKRQSSTVGVGVIRKLLGVLGENHATRGIVACTSTFTQPAIQTAKKSIALIAAIEQTANDAPVLNATVTKAKAYRNKYEEAEALVKKYPELSPRLAISFPWRKAPRRMILFEALSMALQVRHKDVE